ncbi:MAG: YdcF family protein [Lysobacter sp.]|nr:YdcF family protein [Lysobacter sp.]
MPHLRQLIVMLSYPPVLSAWMLALALLLVLFAGRRRIATVLAVGAFGWTFLWSLPMCSDWLRDTLAARNPAVAVQALPRADAIVVLGGGDRYGWMAWPGVSADLLPFSRVAAGARVWHADRAPLVILSGGRGGRHTEALGMARGIERLGVPASALLLEQRSRDTRDNAFYTARLAREHDMRSVLLVTSAVHMPRASLWFRDAGITVTPVPVPEPTVGDVPGRPRWLPSRSALWRSGRALKEYAGLLGAIVRQRVQPLPTRACSARGAPSARRQSAFHGLHAA